MHPHFLLGPAGSGKTHRCLAEIRAELIARPVGRPLIFLAPKQATFQIERQLLADGSLPGYTRLQILSFERLAEIILAECAGPAPRLLSEEGRVMVLRALLAVKQPELKIFHATARLPGFAQQLSLLLREFQRHHLPPAELTKLAARPGLAAQLQNKLHDLALLLQAYLDWLKERRLEDANRLLDLATEILRHQNAQAVPQQSPPTLFGGLWLDGFAEMTPQELDFLAAVVARCERATIAFCLEATPQDDLSWLSTWSVVSQTFRQCYGRLHLAGQRPEVEILPRRSAASRFSANPVLTHLEQYWAAANPPALAMAASSLPAAIRLIACPNPEAEAVLAAREILRHAQAGGRFREVAVVVRRLQAHAAFIRHVFTRYEIPFFIDQRESVAHHPLAELTRYALRTVAFNWRQEDWFGALKSGLAHPNEAQLDELENEALERGWEGPAWQRSFHFDESNRHTEFLEKLRERLAKPFLKFRAALEIGPEKFAPTGAQLANALRELWDDLRVSETLQQWSDAWEQMPKRAMAGLQPAVHATVWQEMQEWLDNVVLAFASQAMPLRDWLPVLEAGLSQLTVGVIPPALDQVLVGAVDRSRNPDLQLTLVLGMNETIFPAPPPPAHLLSEDERLALEQAQVFLGPTARLRLGHERYYGYIACTRARRQLILAWADCDTAGDKLNPSPFLEQVRRLFPGLVGESFVPALDWPNSVHMCEVLPALLQPGHLLASRLGELSRPLEQLRGYRAGETISPAVAEELYRKELATSVSAIERFGACPFQFFIHSGLGAEERQLFEVDALKLGSFQHEVLARFHEELAKDGQPWRAVPPAEARGRIARIAGAVARGFNQGLFEASAQNKFTRDVLSEALQDFVEVAITWMSTYQFDPVQVELGFGMADAKMPAWELPLGEGHRLAFRGRIDRIDVCPANRPGELFCVVVDYKSSSRKLDPVLLEFGIQLQLPAYLSVLRHVPEARGLLRAASLLPVGVFYVNLRGTYEPAQTRAQVLKDPAAAKRRAYQHAGRFDLYVLPKLDCNALNATAAKSGQFNYRLKKDGQPYAYCTDPVKKEDFLDLLDKVEWNLSRMGVEIYRGTAQVNPYQKKNEIACDHCEYQSICRIDFWTHQFRRLPARLVKSIAVPQREQARAPAALAPLQKPKILPSGQLSFLDL